MSGTQSSGGAQRPPSIMPHHYQPSSSSDYDVEMIDSGKMPTKDKKRFVIAEMQTDKCVLRANESDWPKLWEAAVKCGWLCSDAIINEIESAFSKRSPAALLQLPRQRQTSKPQHYLDPNTSSTTGTKKKPHMRWHLSSKGAVFDESVETKLVRNVVALANDVLSQAYHLPSASAAQPEPIWRRAAKDSAFLAWESKGIEKRAEPESGQGEQLHPTAARPAVRSVSHSRAQPASDDQVAQATAQLSLKASQIEPRLPSTLLASSSQPPKRKASRVLSEGYQHLTGRSHPVSHSAMPLSGADPSPAIEKPDDPLRGRSKPDALLLHADHRAVLSTLAISGKGKGKEEVPAVKVIATEIRLILEAKRGKGKSAHEDAEEGAYLETLLVKNGLKLAGNVWFLILAGTELTLYCVNAGLIIRMPPIDGEKRPADFIRLILLVASHGTCRSYWDQRRSDGDGSTGEQTCPDYLQPQINDILTVTALPSDMVCDQEIRGLGIRDPHSLLADLTGSLAFRSDVTKKDWYFTPSRRSIPFRLCGSRTGVFAAHGIVHTKLSKSRENVVVKHSFPKRAALGLEPAFYFLLQKSDKISETIKMRLPTVLLHGRAQVDAIDPFETTFGDDSRFRVPVMTVFPETRFLLKSLSVWQLALVLADVVFLVQVLWEQEHILHHDISLGNVCSRLNAAEMDARTHEVLGRFRKVHHTLATQSPLVALETLMERDGSAGVPIGCLIDFGNACKASVEHDTAPPSDEELARQVSQTRSGTQAFWSALDWTRAHNFAVGLPPPRTRHGPEDELQGLLFVFVAIESELAAGPHSDRTWSKLERDEWKAIATLAQARFFAEAVQAKVTISPAALKVAEQWKRKLDKAERDSEELLWEPETDPATIPEIRHGLFASVQKLLIEYAFQLAGESLL